MDNQARVLLVQTVLREAMTGPLFDVALEENLYRTVALIEKSVRRNGAPSIVVLPEFFLTGLSSTRTHEQCLEMARRVPGPETTVLGELSREYGLYVAGATWELDPEWEGRFFNTAFIVGPSGEVELKYRKHNEGNYQLGLTDTTPGDVYDDYLERYGEEAMWPVLDTEHGRLACVICFDLNFAETTRMLALRGAEVILNPTGEPYGEHRDTWELSRRTRAFENLVYFVSTNHGGYVPTVRGERFAADSPGQFSRREPGGITPTSRSHGGSEVVDFRGIVTARIDGQGEAVLEAVLDLAALRRAREEWPAVLPTAQAITPDQAEIFADGYAVAPGFPLNKLLRDPLRARSDGPRHLAEVVDSLRSSPLVLDGDEQADGTLERAVALAFQADVVFAPPGSTAHEVRALAEDHIAATGEYLSTELARTHAELVVLPDGWPVSFLCARDGPAPDAGVSLDGPELAAVGALAAANGVHLAGAVLERSAGDGVPYRTAFLVDDRGELVLVHRSLTRGPAGYEPAAEVALGEPARHGASPARGGPIAVRATRLGVLALVVGREVLSVEIMRLLAAQGAEIVLNPFAEHDATLLQGLRQARRVRAAENCLHLVAAGQGRLGRPAPPAAARGSSTIVDHDGEELASLDGGRCAGIAATVDLAAARRRRGSGRMNRLVQLRPRLYVPGYRRLAAREAPGPARGEGLAPPQRCAAGEAGQVPDRLVRAGQGRAE